MSKTGAQDTTLVGFSMGRGEVAHYMSHHGGKSALKTALISSILPYRLKTDDNLTGTEDKTVPINASARVTVKGIPEVKLIEYKGAPHGLFATEKECLTQGLLNFLG